MKLSFRHIKDRIAEDVTIDEISEKLFSAWSRKYI